MRVRTALIGAVVTAIGVTVGVVVVNPLGAQGGPCGVRMGMPVPDARPPLADLAPDALADLGLPWLVDAPNGELPMLVGRTEAREMVTGPGSPNSTVERFNVSGTDLGIMWAGSRGQVFLLFGDTVGICGRDGDDWRSNVLLRSRDHTLDNGMRIVDAARTEGALARQPIAGYLSGGPGRPPEYTVIPTAGIELDGKQYARFMSVRSWDAPGEWSTNYSGLVVSADEGETWEPVPTATRAVFGGVPPDVFGPELGAEHFQQSAYLRGFDGYVYEYGMESGRFGPARLARFRPADIAVPQRYEYFAGGRWVPSMVAAGPVIGGAVSELSVQWSPYLGAYLAMHTDPSDGLVLRLAQAPEGPWSEAVPLIHPSMLPGLYGGFMHPWSDGRYLTFVVTTWDHYNVVLMRADLATLPRLPEMRRDLR